MRPRPDKGSDAWELQVDLPRDPVSGRRRRVTRIVRGGKRFASAELAKLSADAQRGRIHATTATLAEVIDAWLGQAYPALQKKSRPTKPTSC